MASRNEWKKGEAVVVRTVRQTDGEGQETSYTEAEGVNSVTGQKQTFRGEVRGAPGFLGLRSQVYPKKGEKVEVEVDPDKFLFIFPHPYEIRKEK